MIIESLFCSMSFLIADLIFSSVFRFFKVESFRGYHKESLMYGKFFFEVRFQKNLNISFGLN